MLATADDFRAVDFQEAIASIERADCMALFEAFAQAAHAALFDPVAASF